MEFIPCAHPANPTAPPAIEIGPLVFDVLVVTGQAAIVAAVILATGALVPGDTAKPYMAEAADDGERKASSPGKMQREVARDQAPRDVVRVDPAHNPNVAGQEPHVHFRDGTPSNQSGSVHDASHGQPSPSREAIKWLIRHGWTPSGS